MAKHGLEEYVEVSEDGRCSKYTGHDYVKSLSLKSDVTRRMLSEFNKYIPKDMQEFESGTGGRGGYASKLQNFCLEGENSSKEGYSIESDYDMKNGIVELEDVNFGLSVGPYLCTINESGNFMMRDQFLYDEQVDVSISDLEQRMAALDKIRGIYQKIIGK